MPRGRRFDPALLVDDQVTLAVQVNGKLRDTLTAPRGLDRARPRRSRWRRTRSSASSTAQPAQGDCGSRPAGQYRRMMRRSPLSCCSLALAGCGLQPLYAGGATGAVADAALGPGRADRRPVGLAGAQRAGRPARRGRQRRRRPTGSTSSSTTISPASASAATAPRPASGGRCGRAISWSTLRNGHGGARRHRRFRRRHRRRQLANMRPSPPSRPRSSNLSRLIADQIVARLALYASRNRPAK